MNQRRRRNLAKILAHRAIMTRLADGPWGAIDREVADEVHTIAMQLLSSMSDSAYEQAEADNRRWIEEEEEYL